MVLCGNKKISGCKFRSGGFCAVLLAGCLITASLTGCGSGSTEDVSDSLAGAGGNRTVTEGTATEEAAADGSAADQSASGEEQSAYTFAGGVIVVSEMFTERDLSGEYDPEEAQEIVLSGEDVTITKEGVYLLRGTMADGMIIVDAGQEDKVQLVLDGVEIDNEANAAIYVKAGDKVFITLAEGSENSLTSRGYRSLNDDHIDGVIYAKSDLVINGTGSLTVNAAEGHGIVSRDDLKITGGSVVVSAEKQGLSGKDSVRIGGGNIQITSGKDGVHAENKDDAEQGYVFIADGTLRISAQGDGVSAGSVVQIDGGTVEIAAGGGSGNRTVAVDENGEAVSAKGIKASAELAVNRGILSIDAQDDAIHSDLNVVINGGELSLATGDDGIHADELVTVTGGDINISESYEGIEGNHVEISGGRIRLYAADDGVNAAGGNDSSGFGGMFGGGERFGNTGNDQWNPGREWNGGREPGNGGNGQWNPEKEGSGEGNPGREPGDGWDGQWNPESEGSGEGDPGREPGNGWNGQWNPESEGSVEGDPGREPGDDGNGGRDNRKPDHVGNEKGEPENGSSGSAENTEGRSDSIDVDSDVPYIWISGGVIYVRADGDGLDSNGDLLVSGGEVYISGPENGANGAIDYDGKGQITGGIVVAAGNSGMAMNFGNTSTQGSILITTAEHLSGTVITMKDSEGNELVSYPAECMFNSVVVSSPELVLGGTYTVEAGEESMEVTLSDSLIYGSGFGMGGFGNGRMPGGMPDGEVPQSARRNAGG